LNDKKTAKPKFEGILLFRVTNNGIIIIFQEAKPFLKANWGGNGLTGSLSYRLNNAQFPLEQAKLL